MVFFLTTLQLLVQALWRRGVVVVFFLATLQLSIQAFLPNLRSCVQSHHHTIYCG